MGIQGIIASSCWPTQSSLLRTNQTANKYGTTRANMSTVMNEGVKMRCEAVTADFFTVVGLLVEPSTAIAKTKDYLEAYTSIR